MDDFAAEARKISKLLNFWDFGFFVGALKKHSNENSHRRIQLVLQEYFKEKDLAISLNALQNDAQTIKDIFPDCSMEEISALLEEIGNEENRVRIVVKKLLRRNNNLLLKRTFTGGVAEWSTVAKKSKICTDDNIIFDAENQPEGSTIMKKSLLFSLDDTFNAEDQPERSTGGKKSNCFTFDDILDAENQPERSTVTKKPNRFSLDNTFYAENQPERSTVTKKPNLSTLDDPFDAENQPERSTVRKKSNLFTIDEILDAENQPKRSLVRKKPKLFTLDAFNAENQPSTTTDVKNASMPLLGISDVQEEITPLNESQSTITYSLESNQQYNLLEMNEITAPDRDILMSIIESNLKSHEDINNEPSSSNVEQYNNDAVSSNDSLMPKIVTVTTVNEEPTSSSNVKNETSNVPSMVADNLMQLKISSVATVEDSPSKTVNGFNVDVIDLIAATEDVTVATSEDLHTSNAAAKPSNANGDVTSTNNFIVPSTEESVYPSTSNSTNAEHFGTNSGASTSTSASEKTDTGGYHLYKHLMEMFTDVSRKDIKTVCKKYIVNKHRKPSDKLFGIIVSDLLEITSFNREVEKSGRENSIIVVQDSVKDHNHGKKQPILVNSSGTLQPKQKDFSEHPLNLITRVATPFAGLRPPVLTVAQNETLTAHRVGVIRNIGPAQKSTAPVIRQSLAAAMATPLPASPIATESATAPIATESAAAPITTQSVNDPLDEILTDLMDATSDLEEEYEQSSDMELEKTERDNPLIYPLMEMFPEACPQFIRRICRGKSNAPGILDDLISQILESDYPKRQKVASPEQRLDAEEQLEMLKQILPDADPSYLQIHCDRFIDKPDEMKVFIANAIENHSYPKLKDYLRKQQVSAQQKQYTTEFSVENFLEVIPDPVGYFEDPKRKQAKVDIEGQHYAICFLRNHFSKIQLRTIRDYFKQHSQNFLLTFKALEKVGSQCYMKSKRGECRMPEVIQNIPLLQEIAYVKHRAEIQEYIRLQKVKEEQERGTAKAAGLLQTCSCCYDDEVMPKDIYTCDYGCVFCKDCVQRGAEVAFGDGKLDFACLNNCSSHFSLQTLQAVLKPKMFSIVALKKQLEEVKAAGIEDLEMCPFCDFATIPARDDKLFRCLNPECMKESCRLCKEPSHVPLRCEEVEKEDDVKMRTYIENKMTEALLRTCYKCGKKFIKDEGCNKMTCPCGALMCYICNQPVQDYKHFNGPGGDKFNLCPLYSDTNHLHEEAVLKGAEAAKREIGIDSNPSKLKIDPTADVQKHYKEIAKKHPAPPVFPYVDPFVGVNALQDIQDRALQRLEQIQQNANRQRLVQEHQARLHQHHRHHHQH